MQGKHTGIIRGLGIAAISLSAIALLGCLFAAIILGMTGSAFGGRMMDGLSYELMDEFGYYYDPMLAVGVDSAIGLVVGIVGLVVGWTALACVVSLIAGIFGTRYAANPAKLGSVFGWGLAGAGAAFLSGRIITMVLLIIMAVLAKKAQDDFANAQWANAAAAQGQAPYGQPVYPQGYAQSGYQQTAPAYAPQQPVAAQPVAYAPAAQPNVEPSPYQQTYAPQAVDAQPAVAQPAAEPVAATPTPAAEPVAPTEPAAPVEVIAEPVAEPVVPAEPTAEAPAQESETIVLEAEPVSAEPAKSEEAPRA